MPKKPITIQLDPHHKLYFKIRRTWVRSPIEKVKKSKKTYNRRLENKRVKDILSKEDF